MLSKLRHMTKDELHNYFCEWRSPFMKNMSEGSKAPVSFCYDNNGNSCTKIEGRVTMYWYYIEKNVQAKTEPPFKITKSEHVGDFFDIVLN